MQKRPQDIQLEASNSSPSGSNPNMNEWWNTVFDENLADLLLERDSGKELKQTAQFLLDELDIRSGDKLFDQCCGTGSISSALASYGIRVIGLDQSPVYVERAQARALQDCEFTVGDAFEFSPESVCDAAINWYTSFGYLADDDLNSRMLERVFHCLKPGGRFALDYTNMLNVLRDNRLVMAAERSLESGTVTGFRQSEIDLSNGMLKQNWTIVSPEGVAKQSGGQMRVYMPWDLQKLLEKVGFTDITFWGGVDRQDLSPKSPRCICVAQKP